MMDELELLKKDWQKKDEHLPKLSYNELHTMIWKKSSSIVKWILIISILEILLPQLIYLSPSMREDLSLYSTSNFGSWFLGLSVLFYVGVAYFIYQFYRRYREISVLDNAKNLMRKIIKTRKTVKYYVIFSLSMSLLIFMLFAFFVYVDDSLLLSIEGVKEQANKIPIERLRTTIMWIMIIGGIVFTAFIAGLYFLIYGLLLRKLNHNYKELKKLEV